MIKNTYTPQILFYCEGSSDKHFVNALKLAYGDNPRFSVQGGQGGSVKDVLKKCINVGGDYKKYCIVDIKPEIGKEDRKLAQDNNVTLIEVSPYLECVILNILEDTDIYNSGQDKNTAKTKLKILKGNMDLTDYLKSKITKSILEERSNRLAGFKIVVELFENYKVEYIGQQNSYKSPS